MSSFSIGEQAYLLVADTGDNDAKRKHVQFYVVPEPDLNLDDKVKIYAPPYASWADPTPPLLVLRDIDTERRARAPDRESDPGTP